MLTETRSVWGNGQLLAFSGIDGATDFDHGLTLRTEGPALPCDVNSQLMA